MPALAERVLERCRAQKLRVATAESCTGGMVATALTGIAGSSDVFERGFVTYSNDAKAESLGVPRDILRAHGAVSEPVARAMAEGAIAHSYAEIAVAITGIAGPGGGGPGKPVGLVHFASTRKGGTTRAEHHVFAGDRAAVRAQSAELALRLLLQQAEQA